MLYDETAEHDLFLEVTKIINDTIPKASQITSPAADYTFSAAWQKTNRIRDTEEKIDAKANFLKRALAPPMVQVTFSHCPYENSYILQEWNELVNKNYKRAIPRIEECVLKVCDHAFESYSPSVASE